MSNTVVSGSPSLYEQMTDKLNCNYGVFFPDCFTASGRDITDCDINLGRLVYSAEYSLEPLRCKCIEIVTLIDRDIKKLSDSNQPVLENSEKRNISKLTQNIKEKIECEFFKIEKLEKEIEFLNKQCQLLIEKIDVINFEKNVHPASLKKFAQVMKSVAKEMLENNKKIEAEVVRKFYEKITAFGTALETVEETTKAEEAPKKRCQLGRRLLPFMAKAVAGVALVCYAYLIAQNVNQQPFGTGNM